MALKRVMLLCRLTKKDTKTIKDFNKIADEMKKGDSILVLVYREGMTIYITLSP